MGALTSRPKASDYKQVAEDETPQSGSDEEVWGCMESCSQFSRPSSESSRSAAEDSIFDDLCEGQANSLVLKSLLTCPLGVPEEVRKILKDKRENPDARVGSKLTMFDSCGPAVFLLWPATIMNLCFAIFIPWFANMHTECSEFGTPSYPGWLWVIFAPFLGAMLALEWRCLTYIVVPFLQWLPAMPMPFFKEPPFLLWLSYSSAVSVISHMDVMTQGLFLATTLHTFECPGYQHVNDAWEEVWSTSIFSWATWGSSLERLVIISWAVLVLQIMLFAFFALPAQAVSFACRSEPQGYASGCGLFHIWHASALKSLASSNQMATCSLGHLELSIQRADAELSNEKPDYPRALQILSMELRQLLLRIICISFITNCTKLQARTTVFALNRMVGHGSMDWEGLLSIGLAHITCAVALQTAIQGARRVQRERHSILESLQGASFCDKGQREWNLMFWLLCTIFFVGFVCVLVQLHSLAKLVAAFICKDAVWNFPNKCVDVHAY
ncbi:unnamed protein product [Symbiodinium sp. CCMP2592]|nr:unnamed protein product [Symbiodinium sp. CCMP2592]